MKRLLSILLLVASTCLFGASCDGITSPDGDDIHHAVVKVRGIPDPLFTQLKAWAANKFTQGYIRGLSRNQYWIKVVDIKCPDNQKIEVLTGDILTCLQMEDVARTYKQCLQHILDKILESHTFADNGPCEYMDNWNPQYDPDNLPEDCYVDEIKEEDIIRAALPEPPPLWVQAALISGGVFGPAGVLCPLWMEGCPDDPLRDEEEGPNGPAPDGDR